MALTLIENFSLDFTTTTLLTSVGIVCARILDVGLGTLRTRQIAMGRRGTAATLGFFEVLIWVTAVSAVVGKLDTPYYAIAYALGHACGVFVGLSVDRRLAMGHQVIRIFTRKAAEMAPTLRDEGFRITEFTGKGRDGEVQLLYIEIPKKQMAKLAKRARELDQQCFYIVEDINIVSGNFMTVPTDTGIGSIFKKK